MPKVIPCQIRAAVDEVPTDEVRSKMKSLCGSSGCGCFDPRRLASCDRFYGTTILEPDKDLAANMSKIVISKTGYSNDWGSTYKKVHGLTSEEQALIRSGGVVLITGCPVSGGNSGRGTTVRQVVLRGRKFFPYVPSVDVLSAAGFAADEAVAS